MTPPVVEFGPMSAAYNPPQLVPVMAGGAVPNPVLVPVTDHDVTWDQIVDVVDDYFKVAREERVKVTGEFVNEGQIETYPLTGATVLEPWRGDSANLYERWESTLQSIRRRATIRVIPDASGYLIDVQVLKELEDLERPLLATAGSATFRHDNTLDRMTEPEPALARQDIGEPPRPVANPRQTLGWIGIGRDAALEQVLLAAIHKRLTQGPIIAHPAPAPITAAPTVPVLGPPQPPAVDVGLPPTNAAR